MQKIKSKNKLLLFILSVLIVAVFTAFWFKTPIIRFIDYNIYSNRYHYLECNQLPDFTSAQKIFEEKANQTLEFIKDTEKPDISNLPDEYQKNYISIQNDSTGDNYVSGNYISIRLVLAQNCENKAEIRVTTTSNKYTKDIENYLNNNLKIPFNIIND